MTNDEMDELLADPAKRIVGDIHWRADPSHQNVVRFKAEITSEHSLVLFIHGYCNQAMRSYNFTIVHPDTGRIYALDVGKEHHNSSDDSVVGIIHKHRWRMGVKDTEGYEPSDITAPREQPVKMWRQFCREARMIHHGTMESPLNED